MRKLLVKRLTPNGMNTIGFIYEDRGQLSSRDEVGQAVLADSPGLNAEQIIKKYKGDYLKVVAE